MTAGRSDDHLKDLVTDVVDCDDPALYNRACNALAALLAEHDDAANHSLLFERC